MGPGGQRLLFGEQTGGGTFGGRRLGRQGLRTAPHGTLRAAVREQRRHDDLPPATHGCHGHRIVGQNRIHARLGAHAVCPQARRSAAVRRPGGRTARRTAAHRGRGPGTDARKDRKLRGLRSLRDAESLAAGDRLLHPTVESGHEMPLRKRVSKRVPTGTVIRSTSSRDSSIAGPPAYGSTNAADSSRRTSA